MQSEIVDIIKKAGEKGMSITEIVSESKVPRSKVRIQLARLEGANKVNVRKVGMAKLYILRDLKK